MSDLAYEVNGAPVARFILENDDAKGLFAHIVQEALRQEAPADDKHRPLKPNRLKVTPFADDYNVRYILDSCVDLVGPGRLQLRQHVVETTWVDGPAGSETFGIKDSDTDKLLVPDLGPYTLAMAMIKNSILIETANFDHPES